MSHYSVNAPTTSQLIFFIILGYFSIISVTVHTTGMNEKHGDEE